MAFTSFNTVSRIVHNWGSIQALPDEIKRLGVNAARVLIVSDPGIKAVGILDLAASILAGAGLESHTFSGVKSDPAFDVALAAIAVAREYQPDMVVGIGGGSSLDTAKLTAAMLTNADPIDRYVGMDLIEKPGVPLILVPTTAGTGSEVTSICVLSDTRSQVKKGIVSPYLYARTVLLDPELTTGMPPHITATTGMDALVHAIESFTGKRATVFTDALNIQAIELVGANLRKAYRDGTDRTARENMLFASCITGMAFSNTQNGLDHALALALGGKYHLPHGLLTAFICPWMMEFNLVGAPEKYARIARALGEDTTGMPAVAAAKLAVKAVRSLLVDLNISPRLSAHGIPNDEFPAIAKATVGAARLISNNPRDVTVEDVVALLEANY